MDEMTINYSLDESDVPGYLRTQIAFWPNLGSMCLFVNVLVIGAVWGPLSLLWPAAAMIWLLVALAIFLLQALVSPQWVFVRFKMRKSQSADGMTKTFINKIQLGPRSVTVKGVGLEARTPAGVSWFPWSEMASTKIRTLPGVAVLLFETTINRYFWLYIPQRAFGSPEALRQFVAFCQERMAAATVLDGSPIYRPIATAQQPQVRTPSMLAASQDAIGVSYVRRRDEALEALLWPLRNRPRLVRSILMPRAICSVLIVTALLPIVRPGFMAAVVVAAAAFPLWSPALRGAGAVIEQRRRKLVEFLKTPRAEATYIGEISFRFCADGFLASIPSTGRESFIRWQCVEAIERAPQGFFLRGVGDPTGAAPFVPRRAFRDQMGFDDAAKYISDCIGRSRLSENISAL